MDRIFEDFELYIESIKDELEEILGAGYEVEIVTANNGVTLYGVTIREEGTVASPVFYINDYFREEVAVCDAVTDIMKTRDMQPALKNFNPVDFDKMRENIMYRLINFEENRVLLKDVPYKSVWDLAKIYYVDLGIEDYGSANIMIHNKHMEVWGVSLEELDTIADSNMKEKNPAVIKTMSDMISELLGVKPNKKRAEEMYVVTTPNKIYGASVMLYDNVFEEIAKNYRCELLIIPSSVHEIIVLPDKEGWNREKLKGFIREINANEVSRTDKLSDSLYCYNKNIGFVMMT